MSAQIKFATLESGVFSIWNPKSTMLRKRKETGTKMWFGNLSTMNPFTGSNMNIDVNAIRSTA